MVTPTIVANFACPLVVIEGISTDPAAGVNDRSARETFDGTIVARFSVEVLLWDCPVLPVQVREVQVRSFCWRSDVGMASDVGTSLEKKY
jgi:hypothetical protein